MARSSAFLLAALALGGLLGSQISTAEEDALGCDVYSQGLAYENRYLRDRVAELRLATFYYGVTACGCPESREPGETQQDCVEALGEPPPVPPSWEERGDGP